MGTGTAFSDPASMSASSWAARLAAFKSRRVADSDPRVVECREALAYWRIKRAVDRETGQLSEPGAERLTVALREAAGV